MGRYKKTKNIAKLIANYYGWPKRSSFHFKTLTKSEIVKLALEQHGSSLYKTFPNIASVSDAYNGVDDYHVTIYLKDDNTDGLPKQLDVTLPQGTMTIPTEIIADAGDALPHIAQSVDELSDSNTPTYYGSICCVLQSISNPQFKGLVTSGHVFTHGDYIDYGGVITENERRAVLINGEAKANLFFQQMNYKQDVAILELNELPLLSSNYISFAKGYYTVKDSDLKTTVANVLITSRQNNTRPAFILDYNVSFTINYFNAPQIIRNIILIGSTNDRVTSKTVTIGGDSGSCAYHQASGKLIGMLLGGNNKFSFVLPLQETLEAFNFKPL